MCGWGQNRLHGSRCAPILIDFVKVVFSEFDVSLHSGSLACAFSLFVTLAKLVKN